MLFVYIMTLLSLLNELPDTRRWQARQYDLPHVILFCILACLSWANSYRTLADYIEEKFDTLKDTFELDWGKPPWYTTLRKIILWINYDALKNLVHNHAFDNSITKRYNWNWLHHIMIDWKTLRWSFEWFYDQKAAHILNVFTELNLVLWQEPLPDWIDDKTNEIPVAQKLIEKLWLTQIIYSLDAMHCQKKI